MHTFGFLLDENVAKLKHLFPRNRAKTVHDYQLGGESDQNVIKTAGDQRLIVVTSDAQYPEFFRRVSMSRKSGRHLYGLVIIAPIDIEQQRRLFPLGEIENRMRLNSENITWPMVSTYNLLVRVAEGRRVNIERLPPCPCQDASERAVADKYLGPVKMPLRATTTSG
jgi:hypothetical protein